MKISKPNLTQMFVRMFICIQLVYCIILNKGCIVLVSPYCPLWLPNSTSQYIVHEGDKFAFPLKSSVRPKTFLHNDALLYYPVAAYLWLSLNPFGEEKVSCVTHN